MGFFKTPKINIPAAAPVQEELPVKVEDVKSIMSSDYNAKARQRKTLMSTILSQRPSFGNSGTGQGDASVTGEEGLRKTLG